MVEGIRTFRGVVEGVVGIGAFPIKGSFELVPGYVGALDGG